MAAATSSGESAGSARAIDAALGTLRAATPAARRTAVGVTEPSAAAGPRPTSTSSGVRTMPAVGILTLSPARPVTPSDDSSGRSLRPHASPTSAASSQRTGPLSVDRTPTTTASARVLAGLALRSVYVVVTRAC